MNRAAILASALLVAACATEAGPSAGEPLPQEHELQRELDALRDQYRAALAEHFRALSDATTEETRTAARAAIDDSAHPFRAFCPRALVLADRGRGTDAGLGALLWILRSAADAPAAAMDGAPGTRALERALAEHAGSAALAELPPLLREHGWSVGHERAERALRELSERGAHAGVRRAARLALAEHLLLSTERTGERTREARALLDELASAHATTAQGARAAEVLRALDQLVAGKLAPDFEAVDENGVAWRLSDYRGKIVVLDFWGLW